MNGLAAASQETLSNDADQRIASVRRAILVAASSLVLIVLGETWDRGQAVRSLNLWTIYLPGGIMLGGVFYLLFALARLTGWRNTCLDQVAGADKKTSWLQLQLAETKSRETFLEKERAALEQRLTALQADPVLRRIPVVVLTTSRADTDIARIYELGANSFISKPVRFEALVNVMKALRLYWFETVELPGAK